MNLHEYQAKEILREYGIPVPDFFILSDLNDLERAIEGLGLEKAVIKVQVHAGGRGKAGGVKLAKNKAEIRTYAKQLLGMKIVNNQTGKEGVVAHKLMISPLAGYKNEYYIGAVIDRQNARAVLMASPEGGMDIEEIAEKSPEKIIKIPIKLDGSFRAYQLIELAKFMGWSGDIAKQGMKLAQALGKAFVETDASLVEVNPLVETDEGQLVALDAKISIDENALYRQREIAPMYDPTQIPASEARAKQFDLAFVALEGSIGCMVNGAGLAMATMDMIYHYGGSPANFLDVGGGATQEKVAEGFKLLLSDKNVRAILVNIFGGIMNCETLAAGIIGAAGQVKIEVPLIVRMEGTNVENGRKMLHESGLAITIADSLTEAAKKVVASAKEGAWQS